MGSRSDRSRSGELVVLDAKEGKSFWKEGGDRLCQTLLLRKSRARTDHCTGLGPGEVSGDSNNRFMTVMDKSEFFQGCTASKPLRR